jgi:hypothetical protein
MLGDGGDTGAAVREDHGKNSIDTELDFLTPDGWRACGRATIQKDRGIGSAKGGVELTGLLSDYGIVNTDYANKGATVTQVAKEMVELNRADYVPRIRSAPNKQPEKYEGTFEWVQGKWKRP